MLPLRSFLPPSSALRPRADQRRRRAARPNGNCGAQSHSPCAAAPSAHGLAPPVHRLALYSSLSEMLVLTSPVIADGLAAGRPVLVITTPPNVAALGERFGARVDFVDAHLWYSTPGQAMGALHEYLVHADGQPVTVIGEPSWAWSSARTASERAEWVCVEAAINAAFAGAPVSLLCLYDASQVPATLIEEARRTHPELAGPPVRRSGDFVDPYAFVPTGFPEPSPIPTGSVALDFEPGDAAVVQEFVADSARGIGLPGDRTRDLARAAREVVREVSWPLPGRVWVWAEGSAVHCEIIVDGYQVPRIAGYLRPDPYHGRGHGLWLCRHLADLLTVHPVGTGSIIRMSMHHQGARGGAGCTDLPRPRRPRVDAYTVRR